MKFKITASTLYGVVLFITVAVTGVTAQSATCSIVPNSALAVADRQSISGTVTFTTVPGGVNVTVGLTGFNSTDSFSEHGFHVHELGDITTNGCNSVGGHYNPTSMAHGARTNATRHVGDLGNIVEEGSGAISTSFTDTVISLSGSYSILNRSIVIHETADSYTGSSGYAGVKIACCVITDTATTAAPSSSAVTTVSVWLLMVSPIYSNLCR